MKKTLFLLLAITLVFTACNKQKAVKDNNDKEEIASTESNSELSTEPGESVEIVTEESKPGEYVSVMLTKYVSTGTYYMRQKITKDGENIIKEVAVTGNKAAMKDSSGTQIIDDETLYYVIPEQKVVLTSLVDESMKKGYTAIISVKTEEEALAALQSTGKEKINDIEYTYEEYKNSKGNLERYYFDSSTIRYIKQYDAQSVETLTEILELSLKIPNGFFDIPDGYIVQDLSKMQE